MGKLLGKFNCRNAQMQLQAVLVCSCNSLKNQHINVVAQQCSSGILQRNSFKFYLELRLYCNEYIKCVFCYKHIRQCLLQIQVNITLKGDVIKPRAVNALYTRCSSRIANSIAVETSLTMRKLYNGLKALDWLTNWQIVFSFENLSCMFLHMLSGCLL